MKRIGPISRIAFALAMLTVSLLVLADILGLLPSRYNQLLEQRQTVAESLAIQLSALAAREQYPVLEHTVQTIVARNPETLSAALRRTDGQVVATFGDHRRLWDERLGERSTLTHVRVPILQGQRKWGELQIRFRDLDGGGLMALLNHASLGLVLFTGLLGFVSYWLFLRRALRALDPSSVIPDRVRSAFDLMAEGVVILDEKGQVVLANAAFGRHLDIDPMELLGRDLSAWDWQTQDPQAPLPWEAARRQRQRSTGVPLTLLRGDDEAKRTIFTVNSAPIQDAKGQARGVFVTFDDMTILERKNAELSSALDQLTRSRAEIMRQNEELQFLATRDPMTGVFNRRALFEQFQQVFDRAREADTPLSAMMVDIDHFKAVNDNYGHAVGDEVIKLVAAILDDCAPQRAIVGRYGGEEFAVILPDHALDAAETLAETIRRRILESSGNTELPIRRLTASLGVSQLGPEIDSPDALIDLADQALYQAKTRGRNRVVRADRLEPAPETEPEAAPATAVPEQDLEERIRELRQLAEQRKKALEQGLRHDTDTGLPNRNLLKERIDELMARQERQHGYGAVISLNVNSYEVVVKAHGYELADTFMRKIAERLKQHLRVTDSVVGSGDIENATLDFYRISSSELGILLPDLDTRQDVINVLVRLEALLASPVQVADSEFLPQTEMGVALYPIDGDDSETLLRKASAARCSAGSQGMPRLFNFYSEKMNDFAKERLRLESELQRALENDEFELWYQPRVSIASGAIEGLEALIRWNHPERGLVTPDRFIPVAEQSDLIRRIGDWVLRRAFAQLRAWRGTEHERLHIAVNVSPTQFLSREFADEMIRLAGEAGIATGRLDIELTEGVLVQDPDYARATMRRLAERDVNIYLDDFGTGYSSLGYLKTLPIDGLKIDRSFVQDITRSSRERAIVRSVVGMAQGLGLDLVAEGIETREQLTALAELGCTEFQGYYFSRPLPIGEIERLLDAREDGDPQPLHARMRQAGGAR